MRVLRWIESWPIWLTRGIVVAMGLITIAGWAGFAAAEVSKGKDEAVVISNMTGAPMRASFDLSNLDQNIESGESREFRTAASGIQNLRVATALQSGTVIDISFMRDRWFSRFEVSFDQVAPREMAQP